ncbi:winged helix-turn-helix transcriptional regulator [Georgenia subflava]|uniref:Transcriptional regulator n=1 Tax=Georgenia subflava TaxID=1622177 RepID=A0A6N7EHR4_9MICO|nr:helix-turn-helix domain-containing protein [Georgenia subflava]MPV36185.1 transcriptional regulator [Georgenia subflava]
MTVRRRYEDSCGMAQGLNLVGDRWALLVVRELVLGPRRFTDLRADLPGISPNVLSQRLEELEAAAVLRRRRLPPPAPAQVYELTEWGAELETVIVQLGRWGARSPSFDRESGLSASSAVLSMRTMFRAEAAGGLSLRLALRLGERTFRATVANGRLDVVPADDLGPAGARPRSGDADLLGPGPGDLLELGPGGVDAVVTAAPGDLAGLLYDGLDLEVALRSGAVSVEGDVAALRSYLGCFWLPEPAPAPG